MKRECQASQRQRRLCTSLVLVLCAEPLASAQVSEGLGSLPPVIVKPVSGNNTAMSSSALTMQAWKALEQKQFTQVMRWANECIRRYRSQALRQQATLSDYAPRQKAFQYWALNDVATCLFIKGRALRWQGKKQEAREIFSDIAEHYRFAQCWDTRGWFWKVSTAARDQIDCIELGIDFGDYTSQTLTAKAWEAFDAKKYRIVELYANKCLELYAEEARKMQATLNGYAGKGQEFNYWALNDVGTCLFIKGRALLEQNRKEEARAVFREIIENYSYAQCWDSKGWFWKVARGARDYGGKPKG